jgi:undecaprenyl diphosphate synthase
MAGYTEVPGHLGVILDGNRRWAKAKGIPSLKGHTKGADVLRDIALEALNSGVKCMSAYVFSTENWQRSKTEVTYLMRLIIRFLDKYIQEFVDNDIKLVFVGARDGLPKSVLQTIDSAVEQTKTFKRGTLALCINYGGQQEIVDAARKLIRHKADPNKLSPKEFEKYLYAPEIPPLDLVIRTSGEYRTSGFMLYRAAYAEYMFVDKMWPDFTKKDLHTVLEYYKKRQRRFGK